jgi:hypothetical protein
MPVDKPAPAEIANNYQNVVDHLTAAQRQALPGAVTAVSMLAETDIGGHFVWAAITPATATLASIQLLESGGGIASATFTADADGSTLSLDAASAIGYA